MSAIDAPTPRKGLQFRHGRILDENDQRAVCTVSKVVSGAIYYRVGDGKKSREWTTPERWITVVYGGPA